MPLTCNINAKGKLVRSVIGIIVALTGISLMVFWAASSGTDVAWIVSSVLTVAGAFMIFEGAAGWCVVRALGFKTRI